MDGAKRGPKTDKGKKTSAKNSTKHGLRSDHLTNPQQKTDQTEFLKELVDFYKPVGPLEKLQLERIAICKAKLNTLYELEQAKQEVLFNEQGTNYKLHISKLSYLTPLVQGMLYELLAFKEVVFPCGLTVDTLEGIALEIEEFSGEIVSDDDLREYFPNLTNYLESIDSNEKNLHVILVAIGQKLKFVIDNGDVYGEKIKQLSPSQFAKLKNIQTPEELEFDRELEEYQEQVRIRRGKKAKVNIKKAESEFPLMVDIQNIFEMFTKLWLAYIQTLAEVEGVSHSILLHQRALSLPHDEADLLMRYQTMWERRLSTLMGEFVQLQKIREANESAKALLLKTNQSS